eukprot:842941-Prorocentrum_minimum.AAC.1
MSSPPQCCTVRMNSPPQLVNSPPPLLNLPPPAGEFASSAVNHRQPCPLPALTAAKLGAILQRMPADASDTESDDDTAGVEEEAAARPPLYHAGGYPQVNKQQ